jgi:hypothetical protein
VLLSDATFPFTAAGEYVRSFFQLIAHGQWHSALAYLDLPSSYGRTWTQREIEKELETYGSNGIAISSPTSTSGTPYTSTGVFNDGSGFWLDFSVPLNGNWSDLTAQFEFKKTTEGYAVALEDLHVM